jgi:hypothetical protein
MALSRYRGLPERRQTSGSSLRILGTNGLPQFSILKALRAASFVVQRGTYLLLPAVSAVLSSLDPVFLLGWQLRKGQNERAEVEKRGTAVIEALANGGHYAK